MILTSALLLTTSASAASWSASVRTETGSWSIVRESSNLSFIYDQSVKGQISPVDYRGRSLSPYHSLYGDVNLNDVCARERTAALQGTYASEGRLQLVSSINNSVNMTISKPAGTDIYTIDFCERWPVSMSYSRRVQYSGRQINSREVAGNSQDLVGVSHLYSSELSRETDLRMSLERMSATILATDKEIGRAEVKATRSTDYRLKAHSTGIASLRWRQVDELGEVLNAGDERFTGVYDMEENIRMRSRFVEVRRDDDWLPCCQEGWRSMGSLDRKGFGKSAEGVFDCSCYPAPSGHQLKL
ncbi:MAG: hypothetical protein QUS08_05575 [Methanothrix sp.]|nr:hypothetical protein [Methanothrix sp.]